MRLLLPLLGIKEKQVADNFKNLKEFLRKDGFIGGDFTLIDVTVPENGIHEAAHGLKFTPLDAVLLSSWTSVQETEVVWLFNRFTSTHVYFATNGPARVRAIVGTYKEDNS